MQAPNSFDTIAISAYRNSKDNIGIHTTLDAVIKRIKSGKNGLADKTRHCHALATTDPKAYRKAKNLPAVTFSNIIPDLSAMEVWHV